MARTGATEDKFKSNYFTFEESQRYACHVVCFYSDDEGATWSGPFKWFTEDRNSNPDRYLWTGFFKAGPGHAIQLKTGEHKGRILVGCDHKYQIFGGTAVPADSEDENYYGSHIAYSDDNGESWHMLELDEELHYGNECVPVELSDGRVYLDMRSTGAYKRQRGWSVSGDGGITWSRYTPNPLRTDPGCQGSIVNYNTNGLPSSVILASSTTARPATIFRSGPVWTTAHLERGQFTRSPTASPVIRIWSSSTTAASAYSMKTEHRFTASRSRSARSRLPRSQNTSTNKPSES